jgi:hypothetical protein
MLMFAAMAVVFVASIVAKSKRNERANQAFLRLAREFQGSAERGNWFSQPHARFRYRGAFVVVNYYSLGGKRAKHYTRLIINWPDPQLRMSVEPERFGAAISKFFGMPDIQIGDRAFDRRYLIRGNRIDDIREFLRPEVRYAIEQLRSLRGNDDISVMVQAGRLTVRKLSRLDQYEPLRTFVRLSLDLFDQAVVAQAAGIEFTSDATSPRMNQAVCQVCGEYIVREAVVCAACKTPHHADCWQYNGSCSTYGCGHRHCSVMQPN